MEATNEMDEDVKALRAFVGSIMHDVESKEKADELGAEMMAIRNADIDLY